MALSQAAAAMHSSAAPVQSPTVTKHAGDIHSPDIPAMMDSGPNPVPSARVVDGARQTEMHIDLRSPSFGSVQVHTTVHDSQIGLVIGSDRGNLHTLLAGEVSGLQAALGQQDLHLEQIHFLGQYAGSSTGFFGGTGSQSGSLRQGRAPAAAARGAPLRESSDDPETSAWLTSGLSIHA